MFGHWRRFDIQFFSPDRQPLMIARHPFRIFFQRLEVLDARGALQGAMQQRFALLWKRFDVQDRTGRVIMTVKSPFWKPWTFPFVVNGREVAFVRKKFSGAFTELMTDADNFLIEIVNPQLPPAYRALLLAAAIFIDLQYFERKGDGGVLRSLLDN
jgi:hypothetical protein